MKSNRKKNKKLALFLTVFLLIPGILAFQGFYANSIDAQNNLTRNEDEERKGIHPNYILPDYDLSGTKFVEPFPYFDINDKFIASSDTDYESDAYITVGLKYTCTDSFTLSVDLSPGLHQYDRGRDLSLLPVLNGNPDWQIINIKTDFSYSFSVPFDLFGDHSEFWIWVNGVQKVYNYLTPGQSVTSSGTHTSYPGSYSDPLFVHARMKSLNLWTALRYRASFSVSITWTVTYITYIKANFNWIAPDDGSGAAVPVAFGEVYDLPYQTGGSPKFISVGIPGATPDNIDESQWDSLSVELYDNGNILVNGDNWYTSNPGADIYLVMKSKNIISPQMTIKTDNTDFSMVNYYVDFADGTGYLEKPSLTEPSKGGGFVNVKYLQPNEELICFGTSSIGKFTGLGDVFKKHMQIVLGEINDSRYLWKPSHDIQDSEILGNTILLANRTGFINPDAFFGTFSKAVSQPDTEFYPLFIYETFSDNINRLGIVGSGYSTTPVKFYEYDLTKDFVLDIPNNEFEFTFTADPIPEFQGPGVIEPDFINRTLTGALLKVVEDLDTDGNYYEHSSYEIDVNQELASSGVFLESMTFPESVYTYESMTDFYRGTTYSNYNKIDMQFSGEVPQGMIVSFNVHPKIMSDDNDFTLFEINNAHKILENDHSLLGLFDFYTHSDNPADVLKLPQRNIALQIDLLIKNDTIGEEILLNITLDDPIIYLGDPEPPVGKDITGLYFEIAQDDLGNFIYDETDPDILPANSDTFEYVIPAELGNYYYAALLQDENVITYGKGGVGESCLMFIKGPVPGIFALSSDAGAPDINGSFDLTWGSSDGANNYSVYQYSKFITEINGSLTNLVDEIEALTLPLTGYADGTYYFIVVAHNNEGDTLSNCIDVTVAHPPPPGYFVLSSDAGDPDADGNFGLTWGSSSGANNYSVYRYSKYITHINGSLTKLVDETGALNILLLEYTDGTYYFIVEAHNDYGDTLSNCIGVTVDHPNPPGDFVLSSDAGDPDIDGSFDLTWSSSSGAINYTVYRFSKFITHINGSLTNLVDETGVLTLPLTGYTDGSYYFLVVAHNNDGDTLSNCIEVIVAISILPGDFVLSSDAGDPDTDGDFDLTWGSSSGASNYSVYLGSSFITEITESLINLADETGALTHALTGYTSGIYCFIVVAHNDNGDTLSNCIDVTVAIPPPQTPDIPGYDLLYVIGLVSIITTALIINKRRNFKIK